MSDSAIRTCIDLAGRSSFAAEAIRELESLTERLEAAERLMRARIEGKRGWTEHEGFCEVELGRKPDGTHGPCDCGFQLLSDMRVWLHAGTPEPSGSNMEKERRT